MREQKQPMSVLSLQDVLKSQVFRQEGTTEGQPPGAGEEA